MRLVIFLSLISVLLQASDIVRVEAAKGKLTIGSKQRNMDSFTLGVGEKDDDQKLALELFYKHTGTNKVADFVGMELSKGITQLQFDSFGFEIYPYGKIGTGISFVDLFLKDDDEEISEVQKVNDLRYKQKKLFVSTGVGLIFAQKRDFDIYLEQNIMLLFPLKDNINSTALGVVFKF